MNTYSVKLIEKIKRTPSIESFRFKSDEKIDFIPGQFAKIIFDAEDLNNKEQNKYLSFSCSPTKDYIEFTKRLSESKFSNSLKKLSINDKILIQGPMGKCVFTDEQKNIGFLIGGIGITPVISIVEYIVEKNLDTDVIVVYSSRNNTEIAFRKELDNWLNIKKNIKILYTVTDCKPDDQICIQGHINFDLLKDKVKDLSGRLMYVYGPPAMVSAMKNLCTESGCNNEKIMLESFAGY